MQPEFREELGTMLPDELAFPWFAAREAPWLLSRQLAGPARIAELRHSPCAPLLDRPGLREILARCGDGQIAPRQLQPLADPLEAFQREEDLACDSATKAAYDLAAGADWQRFTISFTGWADRCERSWWRDLQLSRAGGNLVLQLNFPESYRADFEWLFRKDARSLLEYYGHPVRDSGPITLAWTRLDLDPWGKEVLIEELQSDWLRALRQRGSTLSNQFKDPACMSKKRGLKEFLDESQGTYARIWPRALMLATLIFAHRELGARTVWLHQPRTGVRLKNIEGTAPPRSLYTDLPRRFGFTASDRAPEFLYRARHKALANLRRSGRPLFWRLDLEPRIRD